MVCYLSTQSLIHLILSEMCFRSLRRQVLMRANNVTQNCYDFLQAWPWILRLALCQVIASLLNSRSIVNAVVRDGHRISVRQCPGTWHLVWLMYSKLFLTPDHSSEALGIRMRRIGTIWLVRLGGMWSPWCHGNLWNVNQLCIDYVMWHPHVTGHCVTAEEGPTDQDVLLWTSMPREFLTIDYEIQATLHNH